MVSFVRLRNIAGARERIFESRHTVAEPEKQKGNWKQIFGNDNPIHIEIGMGKGQFLMDMARQNPAINYIGIEKYSSVLLRAVQKLKEDTLENIRFIRMDAEYLLEVFGENEIDKIFLNFSDPWPKDRHARRRLPSRDYLQRYDKILTKDGNLEFKTDNRVLFDFAVEELPMSSFHIQKISYDLHKDEEMVKGNVMTEYEERFSSIGTPICKYIITK